MNNPRHWQEYDLVKLLIAIVLVIIVVLMLFAYDPDYHNGFPTLGTSSLVITSATTVTVPAELIASRTATNTSVPSQTSTTTSTPALNSEITPTYTPSPTPTITPTPTFTATVPVALDNCSLAINSRLSVGQAARVLTSLNLRISPGLEQDIISVNETGMILEIIGGPVCTPYIGRAYVWWQVQNQAGIVGWSAEGSALRSFYFLEPMP